MLLQLQTVISDFFKSENYVDLRVYRSSVTYA
jgi:hypothetical protein